LSPLRNNLRICSRLREPSTRAVGKRPGLILVDYPRNPDRVAPAVAGYGGQMGLDFARATVIVVSDRVSQGSTVDSSGPILAAALHGAGYETGQIVVVPDGDQSVESALREAVAT